MSRLFLARHAETVWHKENRYAGGQSDPELTERGARQAEQLAVTAAAIGVEVLVSSPQPRALTTAGPAATALGLDIQVEPGLREASFGIMEGHTVDEMDPEMIRLFRADPVRHTFPGSEPPAEAAARAVAALRAVDAAHHDRVVLVVAHNTLLRLALCSLLGLPLHDYRRVFPRLDNVALTEIRLPADPTAPAALLSLNRAH